MIYYTQEMHPSCLNWQEWVSEFNKNVRLMAQEQVSELAGIIIYRKTRLFGILSGKSDIAVFKLRNEDKYIIRANKRFDTYGRAVEDVLLDKVYLHNHDVIKGYTKENKQEYDRRTNE